MTDLTLTKDLTSEDHSVVYKVSTGLRDRLVQPPSYKMNTSTLNAIGIMLRDENETTFEATETFVAERYQQTWRNNTLVITLRATPGGHELRIEHIRTRYNPEQFRDRIDSVIETFQSFGRALTTSPPFLESPPRGRRLMTETEGEGVARRLFDGGKKKRSRKTKKSLRRRRRTLRK